MAEGMFYTLGLKTGGFTGPLGAAQGAVGAFQSSLSTMMAKAALVAGPLLGVAGAASAVKKAITSAADMESTQVAFKTLIGNADQAKKTLNELKALGASTPFEFPELADAGRKLIAFGESATTVVPALRRIGDVASGVQAPIGEIAEIYGKARVQGQLFAEDINQLTGRGIPVISQFAKILGVTEAEVKKLASEGKITFPLLEQAFINLTSKGGQFFDMMNEQSGTMNGLWSTLQDSIGEVFRIVGQPINDAIRPMLQDAIGFATRLGNGMAAFIDLMASARQSGQLGDLMGASLILAAKETVNVLFSGGKGVADYLGTTLPMIGSAFMDEIASDRAVMFFNSLFLGIGNLLRSELEAGAAAFLSGIGRVQAAADVLAASQQSEQRAGIYLGTAKGAIDGADAGGALARVAGKIKEAHEAGAQAFIDAGKSKVFDTGADRQKLAGIGSALNPEAWKRFMDAINGNSIAEAAKDGAKKVKTSADGLAKAIADAKETTKKPVAKKPASAQFPQPAAQEEERRRAKIYLKSKEESYRDRMARRSAADQPSGFRRQVALINRAGNEATGRVNRRETREPRDPSTGFLATISQTLITINDRLGLLETA